MRAKEHPMMKPASLRDEIKHDSNVGNSFLSNVSMSSDKMSTLSTDIESYRSSNPYDDRFYGEKTNYAEQVSLSRKSYHPCLSQIDLMKRGSSEERRLSVGRNWLQGRAQMS